MKKFTSLFTISLILSFCSSKKETSSVPVTDKDQIENGLISPIVIEGEKITKYSIEERMKLHDVPGASIAIVKGGKLHWAQGYGIANTETGSEVNTETMFQAGSISKPIAALAALKLMDEGKLDIDADVNQYLIGWKIEENRFTESEKVTVRRLLTHTAGMTVHGFPGYKQTDYFPTIIEVLDGEGNTAKIELDTFPDSRWKYSGGGYTVMEKAVEDISGMPLEKYMLENIFPALEMNNSTYEQPLPEKYHANASAAYDVFGDLIEGQWHNYPEQAAAGLWTTPTDLAKYCIEIQEIVAGKKDGILSKAVVDSMLTKHKNDWGLGPSLAWTGDSLRFQHGGKNAGFTNNMIAFANRGDAVIIMTSADNGGKLINEILRAVSEVYGWRLREPRKVSLHPMDTEQLDSFTGRYKYEEQVPEIGDYLVDVERYENQLVVIDPNNDEYDTLNAIDSMKFIDLFDGDEVAFSVEGENLGFLWNGYYQFYKLAE